jgi:hypothetical protein
VLSSSEDNIVNLRVEGIYNILSLNNAIVFFKDARDFCIAEKIIKIHNIKTTMAVFIGGGLIHTFLCILDKIYEHSRDY